MSAKDRLNIFISHSSKDKAFARELDASLSRHGVEVFLDERAIKVGDSIPSKIYEGIEKATHLIYVISKNSLESAWVQEELDIAKMRQKAHLGCKILPVIIDDSMPPVAVQHIKYASFLSWQDSSCFLRSLNQLLDSLDIDVSAPSRVDLRFFNAEHIAYGELEVLVQRVAAYLHGATTAAWSMVGPEPTRSIYSIDAIRVAMKFELEDSVLPSTLQRFVSAIEEHDPDKTSSELWNLRALIEEFRLAISKITPYDALTYADYKAIYDSGARLSKVMIAIREDLVAILLGGIAAANNKE